jgi:MtN3 and saliva related transmembrane protein
MNSQQITKALGWAATLFVIAVALPQLITLLRTHNTSGVSVSSWAIYAASGLLWGAYGYLRRDTAIVVTNAFVFLNGLAICLLATLPHT